MTKEALQPAKRRRLDPNQSREMILDATSRLMRRDGYGAVTARRVATEAGMKAPLVHYYYPTMDDLLLAFYRRTAAQTREMLGVAIASDCPLRALWKLNCDPERTALAAEFIALANHRSVIRNEISRNVGIFRTTQANVLEAILPSSSEAGWMPQAEVAAVLIAALGRALVMESVIGITAGHDLTRNYVETIISRLENQTGLAPQERSGA